MDEIHCPTITTHTSAQPSPQYQKPQSRHRKLVPPHQNCLREENHR